jgi:sulfofructose kinase
VKPIVAIGHAVLDRVYRIDAFPPEPTKVRALEMIESGGGSAANAAATIGRLGGVVELWARIGDDAAGARIRAFLEADGVDTRHVRTLAAGRTSTSAVIVDASGERFIVGERDHAMSLDPSWLPFETIASAGAVLSDLKWVEATLLAFERAQGANVPTVADVDIAGHDLMLVLISLSDYAIFPAQALEDAFPNGSLEEKLGRVLEVGPRHAGVTGGDAGYVWRNRAGQSGRQPAFKVDAVDTTGAGDAFHGAFAWGLVNGWDEAECARVASAVAAMKCRHLGARAGLPTAGELDEFLRAGDGRGLGPRL